MLELNEEEFRENIEYARKGEGSDKDRDIELIKKENRGEYLEFND